MKVVFVCSGGMSSAIVVNALKKEAAKEGLEMDVQAVGASEVEGALENADVCMVAPQIKYKLDSVKEVADAKGIPCDAIAPNLYNPLGGAGLLQRVKELAAG